MQNPAQMAVVSQQVIKLVQSCLRNVFFLFNFFFPGNKEMRADKTRMPVFPSWWKELVSSKIEYTQGTDTAHRVRCFKPPD